MKKTLDWYLKKPGEIVRKEGWMSFFRKAYQHALAPLRVRADIFLSGMLRRIYVRGFHKIFYYTFFATEGKNNDIKWFGATISKCPLDAWIYQEIIWELRPDVIVETGTDRGGSALFFASLFDLIGKGEVITVDITDYSKGVSHPRITKIHDSSIAPHVLEHLARLTKDKKVMVVLDSDHTKEHVLKEMEAYSELVSPGFHMVVEDSNINGHPVLPGWGPGPMEAIKKFLSHRTDFEVDKSREKFMVTFYPRGFLKKVSYIKNA